MPVETFYPSAVVSSANAANTANALWSYNDSVATISLSVPSNTSGDIAVSTFRNASNRSIAEVVSAGATGVSYRYGFRISANASSWGVNTRVSGTLKDSAGNGGSNGGLATYWYNSTQNLTPADLRSSGLEMSGGCGGPSGGVSIDGFAIEITFTNPATFKAATAVRRRDEA